MPLFGSKHKHDNTNAVEETTGGGRHHRTDDHGLNNYPAGTTTGGMEPRVPQQHQGGFGGPGQQGLNSDQAMAATNLAHGGGGAYGHGQGMMTGQPFPNDDAYTSGGVGGHMGGGRAAAAGPGAGGIPPTGTVRHDDTSGGGTGQRLTGKVESAIGSMVGSNALKAKGLQKEQEANSVKLQGRELAEAERLEREALMRRERAVGHGAHPANSQLGAGHIGTGPSGGQYN